MKRIERPSITKLAAKLYEVSFEAQYSVAIEVADFIINIIDYETDISFNDGWFEGKIRVEKFDDVIIIISCLYQEPLPEYLPDDIKKYIRDTADFFNESPLKESF